MGDGMGYIIGRFLFGRCWMLMVIFAKDKDPILGGTKTQNSTRNIMSDICKFFLGRT